MYPNEKYRVLNTDTSMQCECNSGTLTKLQERGECFESCSPYRVRGQSISRVSWTKPYSRPRWYSSNVRTRRAHRLTRFRRHWTRVGLYNATR